MAKKPKGQHRSAKAGSRAAKAADKQARKAAAPSGRRATSRSSTDRPRSQVLPGMGRLRNAKLDNLCEGIGEELDLANRATQDADSLKASALQVMQQRKLQVYKHAGVELARVPGSEKLRVRRTKDQTGDAAVREGQSRADNAEEPAPEQTALPAAESESEELDHDLSNEIH